MSQKKHWEQVYANRPTEKLGWYEPHLQIPLSWIKSLSLPVDASIIDVGGGVSTLVDDLLGAGYRWITVFDISGEALSSVKARLSKNANLITWFEGDITAVDLPTNSYDLWHDRAVFHFLTAVEQQRKYRNNLLKAVKPDGHVIIGTFAPEAPPKCSGLPVQRYSPAQLQETLGKELELQHYEKTLHITPGGVEQMYLYCHFRKTA